MELEMSSAESWDCEQVGHWLRQVGFSQYAHFFQKEHLIDGAILLSLNESDLRQPPLQLKVLGDIKRLISKIQDLRSVCTNRKKYIVKTDSPTYDIDGSYGRSKRRSSYNTSRSSDLESWQEGGEDNDFESKSPANTNTCHNASRDIPKELWKTALSFVYVFTVFLITAFVMVVVHDRVPEMDKYPPLPDLFLDNMPHVPWAFDVCEMVGLVLSIMWFTILFFHKHRFILMRRMFSLMGTIFLLRCVTMLITSLSVPGRHLQCRGKSYGTLYAKIQRTFEIWQGMGMSIQGVRTCGDYMFSGHTSIITLFNFFITEYTPRKFYYLHIVSWCLNFFGIFFLLAAHEHYSIDVFIAFYLNSRLFMYYHTLANNRALMQQDANRTRVWFPMFAFFESKCDGRVPNEFEWPITGVFTLLRRLPSLLGLSKEDVGASIQPHYEGERRKDTLKDTSPRDLKKRKGETKQ